MPSFKRYPVHETVRALLTQAGLEMGNDNLFDARETLVQAVKAIDGVYDGPDVADTIPLAPAAVLATTREPEAEPTVEPVEADPAADEHPEPPIIEWVKKATKADLIHFSEEKEIDLGDASRVAEIRDAILAAIKDDPGAFGIRQDG